MRRVAGRARVGGRAESGRRQRRGTGDAQRRRSAWGCVWMRGESRSHRAVDRPRPGGEGEWWWSCGNWKPVHSRDPLATHGVMVTAADWMCTCQAARSSLPMQGRPQHELVAAVAVVDGGGARVGSRQAGPEWPGLPRFHARLPRLGPIEAQRVLSVAQPLSGRDGTDQLPGKLPIAGQAPTALACTAGRQQTFAQCQRI